MAFPLLFSKSMVIDACFAERVEDWATEAIYRAYLKLVSSPAEIFDQEAAALAVTIEKCCAGRAGEMNPFFAPLLIPAFELSLSRREPFEYEFTGGESDAHRVKCTAAVLQRIGWVWLNLYAKRWCKTLLQTVPREGMSLPALRDLVAAKTYAGCLCAELLPIKKRGLEN